MTRLTWFRSPWFWIAVVSFIAGRGQSFPYGGLVWIESAIADFILIGGAFWVVRFGWRLLRRGASWVDRRTGAHEVEDVQ